MKTPSLISILLSVIGSVAFAYDSDPGYGQRGDVATSPSSRARSTKAVFYKPTMRYFGKGYTVTYRYVQWNDKMVRTGAPAFESAQHRLPESAVTVISGGYDQRVTYYNAAQQQPQAPSAPQPPRSIVTSPAKEIPPIAEGDRKK